MSKAVVNPKRKAPKPVSLISTQPDTDQDMRIVDLPPDFVDRLPMAVYACDAAGRVRWFNDRAVQMWGRTPRTGDSDELYCGSHRLFLNGREIAHAETPMAEVLRTGQPVHGVEVQIERPDGSRVWVMVHIDPINDNGGNVAGAINCFHDITAQKANEDRLSEQDQRLAATYENAAIAISEVDVEGRLLRVNEAACAITGYPRDELLGLKVFDLTHPDDLPQDLESFQGQSEREAATYSLEKRLIRKDGGIAWVNVSSSTVRDADGRFLYGIRVMRDISPRKRAEAVLRDSERQLRSVLAALPMAVYTTDTAGRITFYNQAAVELWGQEPELGSSQWCGSWRLYHPDGTPMRHDECPMAQALIEQRPIRGAEAVLERPDGTRIPFVPYPTPLFDAAGAMTAAVNMLVDVSEQRRAHEVSQRLASIVASSDDAIVSKDLNGVIVTWNKGAERLFGYTAEEAIGRPIVMLIPANLENEEPNILSRIVRGEHIDHYDTIRRRKDGTLVEISLSVSPIRDPRGVIVGASKIARNVTERKRAEARQKVLLDELNHRVKNTLATVQSLAAQSIRGAGVSPRIRQSFEGRLFALSRVHDQLSQSQWEMADLSAILHDIFAPFRGDSDARVRLEGGSVRLEPQAALMLSMVLHELATNAAKYGSLSAPSGALEVKWSVANGAAPPRLLLTWEETGGPEVRPPARLGFGSRLLDRTVNHQLNGSAKLTFEPGGLQCRIEVPLAAQKSGVA